MSRPHPFPTAVLAALAVAALAAAPGIAGADAARDADRPEEEVAAPERGARPLHRSPWYVGFGLGYGTGAVGSSVDRRSFRDLVGGTSTSFAAQLEAGATLGPRTLLGGELLVVGAAAHPDDPLLGRTTRTVRVANLDAVLTFFPLGDGLFFRAGAGASRLSLSVKSASGSEGDAWLGTNVLGGIGYAFRIGRRFSLSMKLDGSRQWYRGAAGPGASRFWAAYGGVAWY
ncbi:conserved hypothetical protein [Anaeromyxobacter sp. K]|uniref:hypothetical protein n=1 Tax=Anaeromyxobacter sp. (strain K) TaxID=447217 RepID=UPI00015F8B17|nr:hypothetical protein [Anaeromyxobacter sp. K]ACG75002.1 conserved hypothetical protein [Anaeromyxobacter sp. K]